MKLFDIFQFTQANCEEFRWKVDENFVLREMCTSRDYAELKIRKESENMLYSEKVMNHFQHPRNVGKMEDADGIGEVGNAKCGDIMKMYIKVENDIITDVSFNTFGCGSAIASSSMATEMIKGKPISEALELTNKAVAEALDGLPPHKMHCSVLAEEAVRAAVEDYYTRSKAVR